MPYQKADKNLYFLTNIFFLFVVFAAYFNSLFGCFIWDDHCLIVDNSLIRHWHNFGRIFCCELHQNSLTNYYRPVQVLSYLLDYSLFRDNPAGYHVANIFLHFFAGSLLFLFLMRLTHRCFLSVAATLLFLIHPVNVGVVAYISGRADSLAAIFIFSSLIFYLKTFYSGLFQAQVRQGPYYYAASLCAFSIALLTKEIAVILPFFICGMDMFLFKRSGRLRRIMPFFVFVFIYLSMRFTFLNFSSGNLFLCKEGFAVFDTGFLARGVIFLKTLLIYIGSLFIPVNLHMERIIAAEPVCIFHGAGVLLCALVFFAAFRMLKKNRRLFAFAVFWFFLWLVPQSAFVLPKIMADHFLYFPSIGIFLIIAFFLDGLGAKKILLAVLCVYFLSFTWFYSQIWKNEFSFFLWTTKHAPSSYKAHDCLADLYLKMGRPDDAIREYKAILNHSLHVISERNINILMTDKSGRSISDKKRKVISSVFYNLGVVYAQEGRLSQAIKAYFRALSVDPDSERTYNNLGLIYEKIGDKKKAEAMFKKAITLNKTYLQPRNNLAVLCAQSGDLAGAVILWKGILKIDSDYKVARENIALAQELIPCGQQTARPKGAPVCSAGGDMFQ